MTQLQPVTHVLFDMDGLLLNTEDLYTLATQQIVCKYGKDYTWDLKAKIMGFVGKDVAVAIVNALDLPLTPDEYIEAMQEIVADLFVTSKFLPDTEDMYTDIIQQIANRYGDDKIYTYEIKSRLMGLMGREAAQAIVDALNLPIAPEEYMSLLQDTCQDFFPACHFLPDTEDIYTIATQQIGDKFGKTFTWDLKVRQMGLASLEYASLIVSEMELPMTPQQYLDQVAEIHANLFPTALLMPGAERLLRHLHSKGVPIALATSSSRENYELKTQRHAQVFELFNHIVTGSSDPDVKRGKPAPDIFLVCASRFPHPSPQPVNCLVFEDAPNGVKAARAAGMQVVMVPDCRMDPQLCLEATQVLKSLDDFQPHLFGLPPYEL